MFTFWNPITFWSKSGWFLDLRSENKPQLLSVLLTAASITNTMLMFFSVVTQWLCCCVSPSGAERMNWLVWLVLFSTLCVPWVMALIKTVRWDVKVICRCLGLTGCFGGFSSLYFYSSLVKQPSFISAGYCVWEQPFNCPTFIKPWEWVTKCHKSKEKKVSSAASPVFYLQGSATYVTVQCLAATLLEISTLSQNSHIITDCTFRYDCVQ